MSGFASTLASRWWRAARCDARAFAEVEGDPGALTQAVVVVIAGGLARGIAWFAEDGWLGIAGSPAVALVFWLVATVLVWVIGVEVMRGRSDFPELLRTLGFAATPLVALAGCAVLSGRAATLASAGIHLWATLAFSIAVREALDMSPVRALVASISALACAFVLLALATSVLFDTAILD